MIHIHGLQALLLIFLFTAKVTSHNVYFNYAGFNLTLTDNETFTEFHLIDHNNTLHVLTQEINFTNYFPKCCPPNYKYETAERKCVKSNDTSVMEMLGIDVNLIKSGLENCEVIVDHVLILDDFKNLLEINGEITYENETFPLGSYCVDGIEDQDEFQDDIVDENVKHKIILRVCYDPEYCINGRGLRCLKKCCPDGQIYINQECGPQPEYGFLTEPHKKSIVNLTDNFAIFSQRRECRLYLGDISDENVTIFENGSISFRVIDEWETHDIKEEVYCYELLEGDPTTSYLLWCVSLEDRKSIKYVFSKIMQSISCICFIATIGVYVFLYKLKKVVHRIVFCYCIAQFTGFAALTYLQMYPSSSPSCEDLGFVVLFGFLAGFSWLTVMCFDMYTTLGSMTSKVGDVAKADLKKTFYYSLYAWSVPILITVFCYYEHTYFLFPESLHAYLGEYYCLLERREGNYGHTIFFTLPVSIAIIANIVFFILTLRYIIQATDNIRKMSDTKKEKKKALSALKKRTFMALKLFLVMGINWTFEIISTLIDFKGYAVTRNIELIFDTLNCSQGIFVFVILVLKWKVVKSIMEKFKVIVVSSVSRSTSVASSSN